MWRRRSSGSGSVSSTVVAESPTCGHATRYRRRVERGSSLVVYKNSRRNMPGFDRAAVLRRGNGCSVESSAALNRKATPRTGWGFGRPVTGSISAGALILAFGDVGMRAGRDDHHGDFEPTLVGDDRAKPDLQALAARQNGRPVRDGAEVGCFRRKHPYVPRHSSPDADVARRRYIPENQLRDATPTRIGMVRTLASSTPSPP